MNFLPFAFGFVVVLKIGAATALASLAATAFPSVAEIGFKQLQISTAPNGNSSRFGVYDGIGWSIDPYPRGVPQITTGDLLRSVLRDADDRL